MRYALEPAVEALQQGAEESSVIKKAKQYLERLSKFKVSNNCQRFAAALELAFRGENVEVVTTEYPVSRVFDVPVGLEYPYANWCLIRSGKFVKIDKADPCASIEKTMKSFGNGARSIIAVTWKSGRGHVFNLLNDDGEIYLMDATANRIKKIRDSEYVKKNIDAEDSFGIIRTDKGTIDKDMKEATLSPDKKTYVCGVVDGKDVGWIKTKWISVASCLSSLGKEGKIFRVAVGSETLGDVKCIEIDEEYGNDFKIWNYKWL